MNFDKDSNSKIFFAGGGGGVGGTDTRTVCQTVSVEVRYNKSTACGCQRSAVAAFRKKGA